MRKLNFKIGSISPCLRNGVLLDIHLPLRNLLLFKSFLNREHEDLVYVGIMLLLLYSPRDKCINTVKDPVCQTDVWLH